MIVSFVVWLIGLFIVPKVVKPFEAGYGVVTVSALFLWSIIVLAITLYFKTRG